MQKWTYRAIVGIGANIIGHLFVRLGSVGKHASQKVIYGPNAFGLLECFVVVEKCVIKIKKWGTIYA
jgi:hypothetical protein